MPYEVFRHDWITYPDILVRKPKDLGAEKFGTYEEITRKLTKKKVDERFEKTNVDLEKKLGIPSKSTVKVSQAPIDALQSPPRTRRSGRSASTIFTLIKPFGIAQTPSRRRTATEVPVQPEAPIEKKKQRTQQ